CGQAPPSVDFIGKATGLALFLSASEPQLSLIPNNGAAMPNDGVRFYMVGARRDVVVKGANQLPAKTNYIVTNDRTKWRTGIRNFARVQYTNLYDGVDLVVYENQGSF